MFGFIKKSRILITSLVIAGMAIVFTGGFAIATAVSQSSVYGGGNPSLFTAGNAHQVSGVDVLDAAATNGPSASDLSLIQAFQNVSRAVAQNVLPTVVRIDISKSVKANPGSNFFQFFFNGQQGNPNGPGNQGGPDNSAPQQIERGYGSGVIIDQRGDTVYVLTNDHVVNAADTYTIITQDGKKYDGKVVGEDSNRDLAVVSFASHDKMPVARLGDSSAARAGDIVYAVGSPYGIQNTITQGIISAVKRNTSDLPDSGGGDGAAKSFTDYIQTDAAINPGNSGGALVNINGEVIGINTWIATQNGGSVGLAFSIPINNAKKVASDIITKGKVEYGWLGVGTTDLADENRPSLKLDRNQNGAFVSNLFDGSPAEQGGLLPGDLITSVNDIDIRSADDLVRNIAGIDSNTSVKLGIIRNGAAQTLNVKLGLRAANLDSASSWPGFGVMPLTAELKQQLQASVTRGQNNGNGPARPGTDLPIGALVVVGVPDGSSANAAGLQTGDQLLELNGQAVKTPGDFYKVLGDTAKSKDLQVKIRRSGRDVTLSWQK